MPGYIYLYHHRESYLNRTHGTRLVVALETLRDITVCVIFGNVIMGLVCLTCAKSMRHAELIQLHFLLWPARAPVLNPRVPSVRDLALILYSAFVLPPIKTQIWSTVTTTVDMTLFYSVSGIWRFLNCTQRNECAVILVTNSGKAFPEVEITNSWLLVSCSCHKIPACAFWD